jgi:hypothetical protein
MPDDASTNSCMKVPDLRISYTERKYIRDDRMRFVVHVQSMQPPERRASVLTTVHFLSPV